MSFTRQDQRHLRPLRTTLKLTSSTRLPSNRSTTSIAKTSTWLVCVITKSWTSALAVRGIQPTSISAAQPLAFLAPTRLRNPTTAVRTPQRLPRTTIPSRHKFSAPQDFLRPFRSHHTTPAPEDCLRPLRPCHNIVTRLTLISHMPSPICRMYVLIDPCVSAHFYPWLPM